MSKYLVVGIFNLLASMPLWLLHRLGGLLGWMAYKQSGSYAECMRENLSRAWQDRPEAEFHTLLNANIIEAGKGMVELAWVWRRPLEQVLAKIKECHGWELVEATLASGKGLVMLTPHLGCFEIIALYVGARMPMTSMYRVPRQAWMDTVVRQGRERGQMKLARADIGGVRTLYKALKRGEVIGILPDQVPGNGEGEWVPFFGRPAYTMTLVTRLLESSGAAVIMCIAERLPRGEGYILRFTPLELNAGLPVTLQINHAVEATVRSCPAQYLWSYNRYKVPSGVQPPDAVKEP